MPSSNMEQNTIVEKEHDPSDTSIDLQQDSNFENDEDVYHLSGLKLASIIAGLALAVLLMAIDTSIIATVTQSRY
jgi:hypothetical protein